MLMYYFHLIFCSGTCVLNTTWCPLLRVYHLSYRTNTGTGPACVLGLATDKAGLKANILSAVT
jgi:hypothetical protein